MIEKTIKMGQEERLINQVHKLTKQNFIYRKTLVACLGHLQTKVEDSGDMLTLKKIQQILDKTGEY